ncbi:MAG: hypothetical protein NC231_05695 [Bacillus sp. (in: Bacteria)]|nr:hypothetical protein [Bacillus sp. (in: firmicutes)]MCM1425681.1 hypothetical protein [Eubacterium sp.]
MLMLQGEWNNVEEYAIYDVVVKTWTKEHWQSKRCRVEDNTFRFAEE